MEAGTETVSGATVILLDSAGVAAEVERGPVILGPDQTGEAYVVMVGAMPAGDHGPPLRSHPSTDEAFYADGELTLLLEDREVVGPGAFVFVPRRMVHTARNSGPPLTRWAEHITQPVETR